MNIPLVFVRTLGTLIAIMVVDARGRRAVLLKTLPIMSLSMLLVGLSMWMADFTDHKILHLTG